jgi:hypothetical protein
VKFSAQAGASGTGDRAVALDDDNMLIVSKFALNIAVTQANVAEVKPQVDRVFSQIGHEEASGKAITVGGLPGFEYTFPTSHPVDGMSRISILFDGKTEYELNCQSTPKKRAEVERPCMHALATLRRKQPRS